MSGSASAPLRRVLAFALGDRRGLARATLLQTLQSLSFVPFTTTVTWVVDTVLGGAAGRPRAATLRLLAVYAVANVALWAVHAAFTARAFAAAQTLVRAAVARVRQAVVDKLTVLSLSAVARRGAGALSNQVTVDLGRLEAFVATLTSGLVPGVALGLAALAWLAWKNPTLAAVAGLAVPLQALVMRALARRLDRLHARAQARGETFGAAMSELVAGLRHTRALGNEAYAAAKVVSHIDELRAAGLDAAVGSTWAALGLQAAEQLMTVVVWCAGGVLYLDGRTTLGELVAFAALLAFVQAGVRAATGAFEAWTAARPGAVALFALLDSDEVEPFPGADPSREDGGGEGARALAPVDGPLELRDVVLRHGGSARAALDGVTLVVPRGQRVALVGESGAGKSSVLDVVLGFHAPTAGEVRIGDAPMADVGSRRVRASAAVMGQEPFLWNATLRENVRLGRPDASDAEVEAACQEAELGRLLARLPERLDTPCGERGALLSGGERQRVALARLFLRAPRLVLLDEATSALDLETEAALEPALDRLLDGRTALVVAHRLSTVLRLDRVVVLSDGRVVEDGAPSALLADPSSRFARLAARQQLSPAAPAI